jgi:hypothetical protein
MKTWNQHEMMNASIEELRAHKTAIMEAEPDVREGEGEFFEVNFSGSSEKRMLKERYLEWVEMSLVAKETNANVNVFYDSLNKPKSVNGYEAPKADATD